MAKIIAIANPKGGVGKTTTALNLAASLAIAEKSVLLVEMDPNGSLAMGCGLDEHSIKGGVYEIFMGAFDCIDAVHDTELPTWISFPAISRLMNRKCDWSRCPRTVFCSKGN